MAHILPFFSFVQAILDSLVPCCYTPLMPPKIRDLKERLLAAHFTRIIRWSQEDNAYVGSLPELCGDCCHHPSDPQNVAAQLDDIAEQTFRVCLRHNLPFDPPGSALVISRHITPNSDTAAFVSDIRRSLGLNQGDFAAALGVSQSTLSKWETGARRPDAAAYKLLRILRQKPELITV